HKSGNNYLTLETEIALNKLKIARITEELLTVPLEKVERAKVKKSVHDLIEQNERLVEQQATKKEQQQAKINSEITINKEKAPQTWRKKLFSKRPKSESKLSLPTVESSAQITKEPRK